MLYGVDASRPGLSALYVLCQCVDLPGSILITSTGSFLRHQIWFIALQSTDVDPGDITGPCIIAGMGGEGGHRRS